jgi:hypothetical protein
MVLARLFEVDAIGVVDQSRSHIAAITEQGALSSPSNSLATSDVLFGAASDSDTNASSTS